MAQQLDPLSATCPRCFAEVWAPCIRLTGPYGQGNPLRRAHPERYAAVRRRVAEDRARELRRRHAPGRPAPD